MEGRATTPEVVVMSPRKITTPVAQYQALVRRMPNQPTSQTPVVATTMAALVYASLGQGPVWDEARLLVDSGSEYPPLISTRMAAQLGLEGQVVSAATQANDEILPLSDVGCLQLSINGLPVTESFVSAPLSHYDIILGESWLRHHRGIMDYVHDQLWQLLPSGPVPLNFDILPPGETRTHLVRPPGDESVAYHLERNLAAMVVEGCYLAQQPGLQLPIAPTQYTELQRQQAIRETPLPANMRALGFGEVWVPTLQTGGRARQQMNWQGSSGAIHRLCDMGKELPEDEELSDFLDADIPRLANNPERSFDFVTSEVHTQLAHLPPEQVDKILTLLGGFESTVFETRAMPRMPPPRQLDMDITETPDARPVAMRHYPVAPQHMPELERQIKALLDAGIIRESVSLYASPVLFAPKKDVKLRLCVDYQRLNRQTLRDCYPTPVVSDFMVHQPLKTARCVCQAERTCDPFILSPWRSECGFVLIPLAYPQLVEARLEV